MRAEHALFFLAALFIFYGCGETTGPAGWVDETELAKENSPHWPAASGNPAQDRYSTLDHINDHNVGVLNIAWSYASDFDIAEAPIIFNGVMYAGAAGQGAVAVNAETGEELWRYIISPDDELDMPCCDHLRGGLAVWKGMVYLTSRTGRLIALNAATGEKIWEQHAFDDSDKGDVCLSPPHAAGGTIILKSSGVSDYIAAFNARTGERAWRFVASPPFVSGNSCRGDGGLAYEPSVDRLYIFVKAVSISSPAIMALDLRTGDMMWRRETAPIDEGAGEGRIILADLEIDGQKRKTLLHPSANGVLYVLDRENGEVLSSKAYAEPGMDSADYVRPISYSRRTSLAYIPVKGKPAANIETNDAAVLQAWDPVAGEEQWRIALAASEHCGGVLSTSGNLTVQGDGEGYLNIYSSDRGRILKRLYIAACVAGAPVTYALGRTQYISVFGRNEDGGGRIIAFRLGGKIPQVGGQASQLPSAPEVKNFPEKITER